MLANLLILLVRLHGVVGSISVKNGQRKRGYYIMTKVGKVDCLILSSFVRGVARKERGSPTFELTQTASELPTDLSSAETNEETYCDGCGKFSFGDICPHCK